MRVRSFIKLLVLMLICQQAAAQRFVTQIGLGVGGKFEQKFPDCSNSGSRGRIMAVVSQFYIPAQNYQIGLQAITSGKLFSIIGGVTSSCQDFDASTNTRTVGYNNMNAASFLLRNRIVFGKGERRKYFGDIGLGVTTYSYGSITADEGTVRRTSFAVSPQAGISFSRFEISCLAILGGKTPAFSGYDTFSRQNVSLSSIASQQLYITFQYSLLKF